MLGGGASICKLPRWDCTLAVWLASVRNNYTPLSRWQMGFSDYGVRAEQREVNSCPTRLSS
jgi:hypothetical protein